MVSEEPERQRVSDAIFAPLFMTRVLIALLQLHLVNLTKDPRSPYVLHSSNPSVVPHIVSLPPKNSRGIGETTNNSYAGYHQPFLDGR